MKVFTVSWAISPEMIATILSYMKDECDEPLPTSRKGVGKVVRKYLQRFGYSVSESMPCKNEETNPLLRRLYPEWSKNLEGL